MQNRRTFLKSVMSITAATFVSGCHRRLIRPPQCPHFDQPDDQLVVDAHCHIFNASDLQVAGFINQVKLKLPDVTILGAMGHLVQQYGWAYAPDANEELRWLRKRIGSREIYPVSSGPSGDIALSATIHGMGRNTDERFAQFWRDISALRSTRVDEFVSRLAKHRSSQLLQSRATTGAEVLNQLQSVEGTHDLIRDERRYSGSGVAIISFLKTFFRFRTENAWTMLQTYGCDSDPGVDLLCPAMVDFDLWLGNAELDNGRTRSHVDKQLEVMREISLATQGRVHAMAPFNPLRAACDGGEGYLQQARDAIEKFGCIGFKLYPPMGFSPADNTSVSSIPVPRCPTSSKKLVDRQRLDAILGSFFEQCGSMNVPVMAHTSPSNAAVANSEKLADPKYWEKLMGGHAEAFVLGASNVRICLGHMGGDRHADKPSEWREHIAAMIKAFPSNVYADLSYYEHVLGSPSTRENLAKQLQVLKQEQVWQNVMYGSDWSMLAAQPRSYAYLNAFSKFLALELQLDKHKSAAILGGTAKSFFGLHHGQPGAERMKRFHGHDTHHMDAWLNR
jgi:predicted TIM-barrel fold metal-dependent hydrolase